MTDSPIESPDGKPIRGHGPTTAAVAAALARLQGEGRWSSLRQLSDALAALPGGGIKLSHASIGQIMRGTRHVTVDELTALATVLDVSPITLLMPAADQPWEEAKLTGPTPRDAEATLEWLQGILPLGGEAGFKDAFEVEAFRRRSLPRWAWKAVKPEDRGLHSDGIGEGK
jgi:hypothetical protein